MTHADPIRIDESSVLSDPVDTKLDAEHVLGELAKTFQEKVQKLCFEIKSSLSEGRVEETSKAVDELQEVADEFMATPLADLCRQIKELVNGKEWTELLNDWVPRLETTIQAAIGFLRDKDLLNGTVSLPEPSKSQSTL